MIFNFSKKTFSTAILLVIFMQAINAQQSLRPRDYGIKIGVMQPGKMNSITDVAGVRVGHTTIIKGDSVRTGVTAIIPSPGNIFQNKIPAAIFSANGFGKLAGYTQVKELGNLETPIILTNTLAVGTAMNALIKYSLNLPGNENAQSVNALVGETNDSWLNDIRGFHVQESDVFAAIENARPDEISEGNIGAGTGTMCFGFKGGIGTASRKLPESLGGYTIGVLVQTNFGGVLQINGVPVGEEMKKFSFSNQLLNNVDGSCMIVVATDAPLDARNLERLARRAFLGLGKTGGIASNGSGDYIIAFSTNNKNAVPHSPENSVLEIDELVNDAISPLFLAAIEATEEAIINSLFAAEDITGKNGRKAIALPVKETVELMKKYNRIESGK